MISVNFQGTVYTGRLIYIEAITDTSKDKDGTVYFTNVGYIVKLMDAFGAEIKIAVDDLKCIIFI